MKQLLFFLCLCHSFSLFAQITLVGTVTDQQTQEPLVGVGIIANQNKTYSTVTDVDGHYSLSLPLGKYQIQFSSVGFTTRSVAIELTQGQTTLDVTLQTAQTELDMVVISASQYEKRIAEETVSIDIIKNNIIKNNNLQDLSDVVERVPGVNIIDGQASIRGGSGYGYGTGSRVQVVVDDLPLITGDFGEVRWDFVPIESVEQVEVLKGASSVLYGSSALNGVINVRTSTAKSEPETQVNMFKGVYFNPRNEKIKWWRENQPNFTGFSLVHKEKKKNGDYVFGTNAYQLNSYLQEGDQQQVRFYLKTRYRSPKVDNLYYGVNFNTMLQDYGRFFLWKHADTAAYEPFDGDNFDRYWLTTIDPYVTYIDKHGFQHKLRTRYYNLVRYRSSWEPTIVSNTIYGEYQIQKHFGNDFTATAGVISNLFGGWTNLYDNGNQIMWTYGYGAYGQLEKKWGKVSTVAGLRYEKNTINKLVDTLQASLPLVGRLGINAELTRTTFLRASFGQGYRAPSLIERFINAELTGVINVFPNPSLVPEQGWNAEMGVKQGFKIGNWNAYVDGTVFWTEYKNMTEFTFTRIGTDIGFQNQNVKGARIVGFEGIVSGEGKIGSLPFKIYGGYTFTYPGDLETDTSQRKVTVFLDNLWQSFGGVDSLQNSILRYRFRNNARLDAELNYKKITAGITLTYNSPMDKIDEVFLYVIPGLNDYRKTHTKGILVTDLRLLYRASKQDTISLLIKNMFNTEYYWRPGIMEAPANVTLQYRMNL
ncbi:MAG: TonB-dependent receptor [Chitinophagales bacterium]|nr:TonB-dependent receptor [Chitinophagales bacterium]